ncbi:MAG: RNA 3'-terminal phosphate cyclase [Chloroflexota bacterium]|nr:RNA 3'-terminal phosphate cyclase [Chloroflexota bacterium]
MNLLTIDGSYGEGGGQILRSALSLAAILGKGVHIVNIRAGRNKPGLRPQHVQAVKAAAALCSATTTGARQHSRELIFEPQSAPRAANYRFEIATAGSATLVLQTMLVPLGLADGPSRVRVSGGTHVAWSPPFQYLEQVYLPAIAPLGFQAKLELPKWGLFPRGGGEIRGLVQPVAETTDSGMDRHVDQPSGGDLPQPGWTLSRGELAELRLLSAASNVGNQVTARQAKQAYNRLADAGFKAQTRLVNPRSTGPGTCLFLLATYSGGGRAGFTGYGRLGYPAERVADDAVDAFLAFHRTGSTVDPYLADQLILPLAMGEHSLSFTTSEITSHLLTNAWVVSRFLGDRFEIEGNQGHPGRVKVVGRSNRAAHH